MINNLIKSFTFASKPLCMGIGAGHIIFYINVYIGIIIILMWFIEAVIATRKNKEDTNNV